MADNVNNLPPPSLNEGSKPTASSVPDTKHLRKKLLLALGISVGADILLSGIELPWLIATFGGSLVLEEFIEQQVSSRIIKWGLPFEITRTDRILGYLPIPGVTRVSVACFRWLFKKKK